MWSAELGKHCLHHSIRHQVLLGCSDLVFKTSGIFILQEIDQLNLNIKTAGINLGAVDKIFQLSYPG